MDYSQLSDFEINKRVFKVLTGAKPLGYPHNADGRSVGNESNGHYCWYDYCNNPADAWPIIQANGICIGYDGISWDASCHLHDIGQVNDWKNHPEKPLRMAMIVFLLIQDSKHA